jgi:hypothetical protein
MVSKIETIQIDKNIYLVGVIHVLDIEYPPIIDIPDIP